MEKYLTPKQMQVLEWIEAYLKANQTMPSRREIAAGVGLSSPATIQQHIEALEKKGFLKRGETRESRALQWTARSKKHFLAQPDQAEHNQLAGSDESASIQTIPLIGTIAAGYPIEVFAHPEPKRVQLELFVSQKEARQSKGDLFMLSVRGDSMIDDGILPHDWVILKRAQKARSGDTVAALLNGEATLKRFHQSKSGLSLHPANPNYPVIPISESDRFEIQGILVGLIRHYSSS